MGTTDEYLKGLESQFQRGQRAIYPITRSDIKTFNLPKGITSINLHEIFTGRLPSRIIMGMVKNSAIHGDLLHNPFQFDHYNLSTMHLNVNSQLYPAQQYQVNFDDGDFMRLYRYGVSCRISTYFIRCLSLGDSWTT